MKTFLTFVLLLFKFYNIFAVDPPYGQLSVKDKDLLGNGKQVALHGMSLFQSNFEEGFPFYDPQAIKALTCQWNSNVVRAPMGIDDGALSYTQEKKDKKVSVEENVQTQKIEKVINAAIEVGMYVIVDWHTHNATSQEEDETEFFTYIATKYGKYKNIIYELFNEPTTNDWPEVKIYQQKIVNVIRKIDPLNLIIAGTPTYSQRVDLASQDKLEGENICYSLHFYAATHKQDLRDKVTVALGNKTCVFVSEYGTVENTGGGAVDEASTKEWWKFLDENKISYVNWALSNKAEGASAFKPGTQASQLGVDERLSPSGTLVKKHLMSQENGVSCIGSTTGSSSGSPSTTPSGSPSTTPSGSPSTTPSGSPSTTPSGSPSTTPSGSPSTTPSGSPSTTPSG